jgi:hypothetical protein
MAWPPPSPLPDDPVVAKWWQRAEQARDADAARAASERAAADILRLRRKVQNVQESVQYALTASEARRHVARNFGPEAAADISLRPAVRRHRQGIPYESRSAGPEEVEHFTRTGRILSVR